MYVAFARIYPAIKQVRRQFTKWNHNERPVAPPRVRNHQIRLIDHLAIDVHNIDIERTGSPTLNSNAVGGCFQYSTELKEFTWRQIGVERNDTIQVRALLGPTDWVGLVQRRNAHKVRYGIDSAAQVHQPLAKIAAQPEKCSA
jgi:hypothetical protein